MTYNEFIQSIKESRENIKFYNSERHHIIPRCLGGTDDEDNLIYLTYREHFIAHKLLAEENPEIESLLYAYWRMCNKKDICTPEEYEEAKLRLIERIKDVPRSEETKQKISEALIGKSHPISDETREKISISMTGKPRKYHHRHNPSGENHHMYGKRHSEETKKKMSEARKSITFNHICISCGNSFTSKGTRAKYCDKCKLIEI